MKIALIGKYGEGETFSGPIKVARCLHSELSSKNSDIIFYEFFFSEYSQSSLLRRLFGFQEVKSTPKLYRVGIFQLMKRIFSERFDIIHIINNQRFTIFVLLLCMFIKSRIIVTLHGSVKQEVHLRLRNFHVKFIYFINEWLYGKVADTLVFPSNHFKKQYNSYYKVSCKQQIIPNAADFEFYEAYQEKELQLPIKIVFYSDAYDETERNTGQVIDQFLKLYDVDYRLYIISSRLNQIDGSEKIIFIKPMRKANLIKFLSDKHILIKSTSFDSFSMFTSECMTIGLVPIISDNVGVKEYIVESENGFVYSKNNPDEIIELIRFILSQHSQDTRFFKKLSESAHELYHKLNWIRVGEQYSTLYKSFYD